VALSEDYDLDWNLYNDLVMLEYSGKPGEALRGLNELEERCTDADERVVVLLAVSNCLVLLDRYGEARQALKKAFALVGKHSHVYPRIAFKDAYIDIYMRDWKKALAKIDAILNESGDTLKIPNNADVLEQVRSSRGIVLLELSRYSEALPLLEEATVARPGDGELLIYLGACYFHLRELDRSKDCFVRALKSEIDTNFRYKAHFYLGSVYYAQGNFAWAKQEFEEALQQGDRQQLSGKNIYEHLKLTSESLGLESEAKRYSELLERVNHASESSK
jgi:tetratricopeptide (TPR) repeat protein